MRSRKRLTSLAAVVAALAVTGGVAAQFTTSTTSAPQQIGTGTLALSLDNVAPTVWTDDISNLAAGDSVERFVDVRNSGSLKIAGLTLSQTNTLGDLLTAPSDISVKLQSCSVAWNVTTGACSGQTGLALSSTSVRDWAATSKALATFEDFGAGDIRHIKLTTTLAPGATNTVQGKKGTITYTFGAAQRTGNTSNTVGTLSQPSGVTTSVVDATSVKVAFTDTNAGSASYFVNWGETGNSATAPQQAAVPAGATSYTVTGLTSGKSYNFSVSAAKNGQSASSTPATVTPKPANLTLVKNTAWAGYLVPSGSIATNTGAATTSGSPAAVIDGNVYNEWVTSGTTSQIDVVFPGIASLTSVRMLYTATGTGSQTVIVKLRDKSGAWVDGGTINRSLIVGYNNVSVPVPAGDYTGVRVVTSQSNQAVSLAEIGLNG